MAASAKVFSLVATNPDLDPEQMKQNKHFAAAASMGRPAFAWRSSKLRCGWQHSSQRKTKVSSKTNTKAVKSPKAKCALMKSQLGDPIISDIDDMRIVQYFDETSHGIAIDDKGECWKVYTMGGDQDG